MADRIIEDSYLANTCDQLLSYYVKAVVGVGRQRDCASNLWLKCVDKQIKNALQPYFMKAFTILVLCSFVLLCGDCHFMFYDDLVFSLFA